MSEIGNLVLPEIEQHFVDDTSTIAAQTFLMFQGRINQQLIDIENFANRVAKQAMILERHEDGSLSGNSIIRQLKQIEAITEWDKDITNLIRDSNLLIQELRTFLTGETIRYQIGIRYYGQIYEFEVPENVLLENVRLSYGTGRTNISTLFTLKLRNSKGLLIKEWQQYQLSSGQGRMSTGSVFSSFLKNKNIIQDSEGRTKKVNLGNIYEATKKYQYQKGRKSQASVFSSITSNIISSTKGGDFDNIQYKFLGRSAPTLADMSVIVNTLKACQELFALGPSQMGEKIKEIFVKDKSQVDSQLELTSLKEIDKHIEELIKSLQI